MGDPVVPCFACGHENPVANRFCGRCGITLARACPSCQHANPPGGRQRAAAPRQRRFRNADPLADTRQLFPEDEIGAPGHAARLKQELGS